MMKSEPYFSGTDDTFPMARSWAGSVGDMSNDLSHGS